MSLTVDYSIDRTSLSLSALDLVRDPATGSGYRVLHGTGPGGTGYLRNYAKSPFAPPILTSAVADTTQMSLIVRCYGSDMTDLRTKVADLRTALGQFSYTITETIGGVATTYACDPADTHIGSRNAPRTGAVGYAWSPADLRLFQQDIICDIPRNPVPTSGSL